MAPLGDQVAHLDPLRVVDDHEGFADQHLLAVAQLDQRRDVLGVERQRLFDQHMLAGFGRLRRPFDMLRGRQRDIDAVDRRRRRAVPHRSRRHGGAPKRSASAWALRQVAAGDRRQHAVLGIDDCRQQLLAADLGRRQNTPAEHAPSLPCIVMREALPEKADCAKLGDDNARTLRRLPAPLKGPP